MYLVDSNVFDAILLDQSQARQARLFIEAEAGQSLHVSDFALHSIGVVLRRHKKLDAFSDFLNDLILNDGIKVLALLPEDLLSVVTVSRELGLDFDDAYQYVVAEKHSLTIVSFDAHFDGTPSGRKTPGELVRPGEDGASDAH